MMPTCFVKGCSNRSKKNPGVTYHLFPKNLKVQWLSAIGRDLDILVNQQRVCSDHFEENDFERMTIGMRKRIKPNVIPTKNLPKATKGSAKGITKAPTSLNILNKEVPICPPKEMNADTDPLLVTPTDHLSLFGDTMDNIEFVVEDDDTTGSNSNSNIIEVTIPNQENGTQGSISNIEYDVIDLDSPSLESSVKEEIKVEEPQVQILNYNANCELFQQPSTSTVLKAGLQKNTICYVPDCTIDSKNKDKITWFRVPRDENLLKIWDICIDRQDKRLSQEDVICEKHFLKEDILHEFSLARKEGKITVPYSMPKLREGAVPCVKFHAECCVPTCRRTSGWMYCFPITRNSDFRLWLYMIKNPILKNLSIKEVLRHRVCENHFEPECFIDKYTLKRSAAPTLLLPVNHGIHVGQVKGASHGEAGQNVGLICIHGECKSNSNTGQNIFRFPLNADRCISWLEACGRHELITTPIETVRILKSSAFGVCEDHFDSQSFHPTLEQLKSNAIPKYYHKSPTFDFRESKAFSVTEPKEVSSSVQHLTTSVNEVESSVTKQSPYVCFYKNCRSKMGDIKFYSFPVEKERYEAWLIACGYPNMAEDVKELFLKTEQICSKHFAKDMIDFENNLKDDAVPHVFKLRTTEQEKKARENAVVRLNNKPIPNRLYCAVESCSNFYTKDSRRTGMYHNFPDPKIDEQRFKIWLSLIANTRICEIYSDERIRQSYIVCYRHFESHFYTNGTKPNSISEEAVPTKNLSVDIQWFFESEYFKSRLQDYYDKMAKQDIAEYKMIEWRKDDVTNNIDEIEDKTKCILEEEGIRFPGMGHYLYMGKNIKRKNCGKRKYPYGVYKHFKTGYGLNDDVEIGEHIKIHTAIIIDDDDDCEKAVLQQLLEKRRKNR